MRQNTRDKTQETRDKTQDTRHKTQDTRHKTQDTRHKAKQTSNKTQQTLRAWEVRWMGGEKGKFVHGRKYVWAGWTKLNSKRSYETYETYEKGNIVYGILKRNVNVEKDTRAS